MGPPAGSGQVNNVNQINQYFITTELVTADARINVITTKLVTVDSVLLFPKDHNHGLVTSYSGNRIV